MHTFIDHGRVHPEPLAPGNLDLVVGRGRDDGLNGGRRRCGGSRSRGRGLGDGRLGGRLGGDAPGTGLWGGQAAAGAGGAGGQAGDGAGRRPGRRGREEMRWRRQRVRKRKESREKQRGKCRCAMRHGRGHEPLCRAPLLVWSGMRKAGAEAGRAKGKGGRAQRRTEGEELARATLAARLALGVLSSCPGFATHRVARADACMVGSKRATGNSGERERQRFALGVLCAREKERVTSSLPPHSSQCGRYPPPCSTPRQAPARPLRRVGPGVRRPPCPEAVEPGRRTTRRRAG